MKIYIEIWRKISIVLSVVGAILYILLIFIDSGMIYSFLPETLLERSSDRYIKYALEIAENQDTSVIKDNYVDVEIIESDDKYLVIIKSDFVIVEARYRWCYDENINDSMVKTIRIVNLNSGSYNKIFTIIDRSYLNLFMLFLGGIIIGYIIYNIFYKMLYEIFFRSKQKKKYKYKYKHKKYDFY